MPINNAPLEANTMLDGGAYPKWKMSHFGCRKNNFEWKTLQAIMLDSSNVIYIWWSPLHGEKMSLSFGASGFERPTWAEWGLEITKSNLSRSLVSGIQPTRSPIPQHHHRTVFRTHPFRRIRTFLRAQLGQPRVGHRAHEHRVPGPEPDPSRWTQPGL